MTQDKSIQGPKEPVWVPQNPPFGAVATLMGLPDLPSIMPVGGPALTDLRVADRPNPSVYVRLRAHGAFPIKELPALDKRPRWSGVEIQKYLEGKATDFAGGSGLAECHALFPRRGTNLRAGGSSFALIFRVEKSP